jgi:hypothetical protein
MTYENGASLALWGTLPCSSATTGIPNNSTSRRCDALRDGGGAKFGTTGLTSDVQQLTPAQKIAAGQWSHAAYQNMADVYYGAATVARVYDFEAEWNAARSDDSPAFFEYVDRIQGAPWNGTCGQHCDPYLDEMYDAHGAP